MHFICGKETVWHALTQFCLQWCTTFMPIFFFMLKEFKRCLIRSIGCEKGQRLQRIRPLFCVANDVVSNVQVCFVLLTS